MGFALVQVVDWDVFHAAFWSLIVLWVGPRGMASVWAAVKAVAS